MIKAHKRTNSGWMRRACRIYLNDLNDVKVDTLHDFLNTYTDAVNYTIVKLWSEGKWDKTLCDKAFTDVIRERFGVTARLAQSIAKHAKESIVACPNRMPRVRQRTANLDQRFVKIENFDGHFDMCIKTGSGVPKLVIPFNIIRQERFEGWKLGKSIRLGYNRTGLFIDLMYEKERPPKRTKGEILGVDLGFNAALATSRGELIGDLGDKIKKSGKRRKSYHHYIVTEENRIVNELNLSDIKVLVLENLKNVKKRSKFGRRTNRLLSFWHYAKVRSRLEQRCEEEGITVEYKSPAYTSQHCPECGNIDRRNRKGQQFSCLQCGHSNNADINGAINLRHLQLAGAYSLRSLPKEVCYN